MSIYQLTNKDNMDYILDVKSNKIIYLSYGKTDNINDVIVDERKVFNHIISIGKLIDNLGSISIKECLEKWHFKSGGNTLYIDMLENEFIENALNIYNNNLNSLEDNNYKQDIININRKIKKLTLMTGIRYFDDVNNLLPSIEEEFFDFFKECHFLYEINNILENIINKKMPLSKLWLFENTNNSTLDLSEIYDITKSIVNNTFNLRPLIKYDDTENKPYYVFSNIFEIAYFHLLSSLTLTQSKVNKGKRTNICELCGFIYIKTGNNSKYCKECFKIATTKRKNEERTKNKM